MSLLPAIQDAAREREKAERLERLNVRNAPWADLTKDAA